MENHIHNGAECAMVRTLFPLTLNPAVLMPSGRREKIIVSRKLPECSKNATLWENSSLEFSSHQSYIDTGVGDTIKYNCI